MVNMILKAATGKRIAIRVGDILEMNEAETPNKTLLLIDHGRNNGDALKFVVVDHPIEEVFDRITEVRGSGW